MDTLFIVWLSVVAFLVVYLFFYFVLRPWWFAHWRVKERHARRVAKEIRRQLRRAFGIGVHGGDDQQHAGVRFVQPLWEGVSLINFRPGEDNTGLIPMPKVNIWDGWGMGMVEYEVWRVNLDIDLNRLPYHSSLTDILNQVKEIEVHLGLVLRARVNIRYWFTNKYGRQDSKKRHRMTINVIYREREKVPEVFVNDVETTGNEYVAYQHYEREHRKDETNRRKNLALRMLQTSMDNLNGEFPIKKIQSYFTREASHRMVESIAVELENIGILLPSEGPKPRRVSPNHKNKLEWYIGQND